jgi:hypothetical protein
MHFGRVHAAFAEQPPAVFQMSALSPSGFGAKVKLGRAAGARELESASNWDSAQSADAPAAMWC